MMMEVRCVVDKKCNAHGGFKVIPGSAFHQFAAVYAATAAHGAAAIPVLPHHDFEMVFSRPWTAEGESAYDSIADRMGLAPGEFSESTIMTAMALSYAFWTSVIAWRRQDDATAAGVGCAITESASDGGAHSRSAVKWAYDHIILAGRKRRSMFERPLRDAMYECNIMLEGMYAAARNDALNSSSSEVMMDPEQQQQYLEQLRLIRLQKAAFERFYECVRDALCRGG